ncbi:ArsR family transcriptional regulator [Actinoallomurus iriomotensis]|uniref:ArsR family transcriptional regulator n=1 Tax=Actinoallomurus iriomotensis TaxID=478107 RepID=A0A9W6RV13_9ACTN|nr:ArsR family transcriptional regulator [Actinoallomurus iriomotensis]
MGGVASDPNPPVPVDTALESVNVLGEETRRRMYAFVRRAGRPVTRDEAAAGVGSSRKLAAFHLDKLVDAGLLRAHYEHPGGLRKVGRQPKRYEPSDATIQVSIPERRHELLADLLMDAVLTETRTEDAQQAAVRVARERGHDLGATERRTTRPGRLGAERGLTVCERMLEHHGFEPVRETTTRLRLRNCPFHPLAAKAPGLVCAMNHAFITGYLDGLQVTGLQGVLSPQPGECCVRLSPAVARGQAGRDRT